MVNVLMIAYQFPPMGGSGVQRTAKFVKHLQAFGYKPIVFTRPADNIRLRDEELLDDIPKNVKVYRTPSSLDLTELPSLFGLAGRLAARKLMIPDGQILWARANLKKALTLIDRRSIKYVYTTSSPYSDHLLGLWIKAHRPDIKWIADFRDEWTNNPYIKDMNYSKRRMNKERMLERQVLDAADAVIANTPVMRDNFLKLCKDPIMRGKTFYVIPNGYDMEDFADIAPKRDPEAGNAKMVVTYTGLMYGRRKPDTFFAALQMLISKGKIDPHRLTVRFIGNYKVAELNDKIASYGLTNVVTLYDYMPHKMCLQMLADSDLLLLIESDGPGSEAFYTGKIFEYMNTDVPTLALLAPYGAAADLMRDTNIGSVARASDKAQVANAFLDFYNQFIGTGIHYSPCREKIAEYERRELTKSLARVFDKLR